MTRLADEQARTLRRRLLDADSDWRAVVLSRDELRALLDERDELRAVLRAIDEEEMVVSAHEAETEHVTDYCGGCASSAPFGQPISHEASCPHLRRRKGTLVHAQGVRPIRATGEADEPHGYCHVGRSSRPARDTEGGATAWA